MTDILQELREPLPKVEGYNGEYVDEDAVLSIFKDAADEIERLRGALERLAELDEFVCGKPQTIEEVMNYTQFVARAALREKE